MDVYFRIRSFGRSPTDASTMASGMFEIEFSTIFFIAYTIRVLYWRLPTASNVEPDKR